MSDIDKFFDDMIEKNEKEAKEELHNNKGHIELIKDLGILLEEAKDCQFHDFLNSTYAMPKVELASRLTRLRQNTISGNYDN